MRTPLDCLRTDRDARTAIPVITSHDMRLHIWPALATPRDILAGRLSDHAAAAFALRDQWVRASLPGRGDGKPDVNMLAKCVLEAMRDAYPTATPDEVDVWLPMDDIAAIMDVARAACGLMTNDPLRIRAVRLSMLGLSDVPMTANESAPLDDYAINAGRAPSWPT